MNTNIFIKTSLLCFLFFSNQTQTGDHSENIAPESGAYTPPTMHPLIRRSRLYSEITGKLFLQYHLRDKCPQGIGLFQESLRIAYLASVLNSRIVPSKEQMFYLVAQHPTIFFSEEEITSNPIPIRPEPISPIVVRRERS